MIKSDAILNVIWDTVKPEEAQATEIVLENSVLQQDALLHIGNCTDYVLTLGKRRALRKFFDLEKLQADNIYTHHRPYGGSGTIYGPKDVVFSLYVNKASFIDEYNVNAADAYNYFVHALHRAILKFKIDCHIDDDEFRSEDDGVCVHLQGRSEIITPSGSKMAVSVFREDELGFYMRGMLLVSDDWTKVYQYLISPIPPDRITVDSMTLQSGYHLFPHEVAQVVITEMTQLFSRGKPDTISQAQHTVIQGIKDKYRVL